jgi:hypothetical protein
MSNIVTARIEIRGTRPLLQHKFGPEALPLEKVEREGVAGNSPNEWRKTCMVTASGQLFVNGTYFFSMIRDASKHTKAKRGSIQPLVSATLQVMDEMVLLDRWVPKEGDPPADPTQPVYIDICGVRNPSTKARNVRYRLATATGWKAAFTIQFDRTIVSRDQMRSVLKDAGTLVGLADGRSVGYGRFVVESFEVLAEAEEAAA